MNRICQCDQYYSPCPLKLFACTSYLVPPPSRVVSKYKNHCYNKATWRPSLHKCQHWEAVGKCLFSDGFFPSPRFPFLCFPFLSQPFPFPAPLVQPPISRSRILPPPLVHVHHHHHHAPFSLFYSSTSHPLWSQHSVAGILQSMFWKCCSDPSIVMLKHLPLRRSCFHCQHSHRTERVGSVRCRGNIGSSGPHKDQPGLLRVSKKWLGACKDNVWVIN